MTIITCPECGSQVPERARVCPNCGFPVPRAKKAGTKASKAESKALKINSVSYSICSLITVIGMFVPHVYQLLDNDYYYNIFKIVTGIWGAVPYVIITVALACCAIGIYELVTGFEIRYRWISRLLPIVNAVLFFSFEVGGLAPFRKVSRALQKYSYYKVGFKAVEYGYYVGFYLMLIGMAGLTIVSVVQIAQELKNN